MPLQVPWHTRSSPWVSTCPPQSLSCPSFYCPKTAPQAQGSFRLPMPVTAAYTFSLLHTVCFLAGSLSKSIWAAVTECHGQSKLYSTDVFCLVVLGARYQQIWSLLRDCFLSIVACLLILSSKSRGDSLVSLCVDISYTDELVYVWDVFLSNTITLQVRVSIYKFGVEYQQ